MNKLRISQSTIKILAMLTMVIDHIGVLLFPGAAWLRCVGRMAFPLFAYGIGEGIRYSSNKKKYCLKILLSATAFQIVAFYMMPSAISPLYGYAIAVAFGFYLEYAKAKGWKQYLPITIGLIALCSAVVSLLQIQYVFATFLIPIIVYLIPKKTIQIPLITCVLVAVSFFYPQQWYCIFATIPMLIYNGEKGFKLNKNFVYIFYPVHIIIIYLISLL